MLVPLTRETFTDIIPLIATGPQYGYYWGGVQQILKKALSSVVGVTIIWLIGLALGDGAQALSLILRIIVGLYWLWGPVYQASLRNNTYRRYPYSGFVRGKILDVYITEEIIGEEEKVNNRGELEIIEIQERRLNLEIEDEIGFIANVKAPLRRSYKVINPGEIAELLIISNKPDLATIDQVTDVYLPRYNLWVGEYPYLRRDVFIQVSQKLGGRRESYSPRKNPPATDRKKRRF